MEEEEQKYMVEKAECMVEKAECMEEKGLAFEACCPPIPLPYEPSMPNVSWSVPITRVCVRACVCPVTRVRVVVGGWGNGCACDSAAGTCSDILHTYILASVRAYGHYRRLVV